MVDACQGPPVAGQVRDASPRRGGRCDAAHQAALAPQHLDGGEVLATVHQRHDQVAQHRAGSCTSPAAHDGRASADSAPVTERVRQLAHSTGAARDSGGLLDQGLAHPQLPENRLARLGHRGRVALRALAEPRATGTRTIQRGGSLGYPTRDAPASPLTDGAASCPPAEVAPWACARTPADPR